MQEKTKRKGARQTHKANKCPERTVCDSTIDALTPSNFARLGSHCEVGKDVVGVDAGESLSYRGCSDTWAETRIYTYTSMNVKTDCLCSRARLTRVLRSGRQWCLRPSPSVCCEWVSAGPTPLPSTGARCSGIWGSLKLHHANVTVHFAPFLLPLNCMLQRRCPSTQSQSPDPTPKPLSAPFFCTTQPTPPNRPNRITMDQRGAPEFILEAFADPNSVRDIVRGASQPRRQSGFVVRCPSTPSQSHDHAQEHPRN